MQENTKRRCKVRFNELYQFVEQMVKTIEVETLRHQQSTFPRNRPRDLFYIELPAEDRQKYGEDKVGRLVKSMYGTQDASHIWLLDYVELDLWRVGRLPKRQTTAQHCFTIQIKMRIVVMADDFVCLPDDEGLQHVDSLLKKQIHSERHGKHLDAKIQT